MEKKLSTLPTLWYGCTIDPMGLTLKSIGQASELALGVRQVPDNGPAKIREKMGVLISQKDTITKQGIDP